MAIDCESFRSLTSGHSARIHRAHCVQYGLLAFCAVSVGRGFNCAKMVDMQDQDVLLALEQIVVRTAFIDLPTPNEVPTVTARTQCFHASLLVLCVVGQGATSSQDQVRSTNFWVAWRRWTRYRLAGSSQVKRQLTTKYRRLCSWAFRWLQRTLLLVSG